MYVCVPTHSAHSNVNMFLFDYANPVAAPSEFAGRLASITIVAWIITTVKPPSLLGIVARPDKARRRNSWVH